MKRIALVFIIAIVIPSVLLAVLAVRTLRVQEMAASSQRVVLHQSTCDGMVANISLFMDDLRIFFGKEVDRLVEQRGADLVNTFDEVITREWAQASVGSVVDDAGLICSPLSTSDNSFAEPFLANHADFLSNRRVVEVYRAPKLLANLVKVQEEAIMSRKTGIWESLKPRSKEPIKGAPEGSVAASLEKEKESIVAGSSAMADALAVDEPIAAADEIQKEVPMEKTARSSMALNGLTQEGEVEIRKKVAASNSKLDAYRFDPSQTQRQAAAPVAVDAVESQVSAQGFEQQVRNVEPARQWMAPSPTSKQQAEMAQIEDLGYNYSRLNRAAVTQNDLTEGEDEGAVSRIIDGSLHVLLWKRHTALPGYTFWVELNPDEIEAELAGLFEVYGKSETNPEISLALLDSNGAPVTQTVPDFEADWTTPFVAAEVGQILPRWEVAAYIIDPEALNAAARTVLITLSLIIIVLVAAVAAGSLLIMRSVNYEMQIASRKTDFVSNVSHELKTPLTSIRMFSELLENSESFDAEQTQKYSSVISKESARLTRLINRLLDFSRLDRGEMKLTFENVDLGDLVRETVDNYRHQIEAEGLEVEVDILPDVSVIVDADRDALSQVLLNLLTNAEKYAASGREVNVRLERPHEGKVALLVQDRGPGISKLHQRRIFEKFYRADESISSGIEGSGIGLALCHQIVEKHEGQIRYSRRDGGGSCFAIELPVSSES